MRADMPIARHILAVALAVAHAAVAGPGSAGAPAVSPHLSGFAPVGPGAGWVVLGDRLLVTDDHGASWRDRTPAILAGAAVAAVAFTDRDRGWAVAARGQDYALAITTDGGATWSTSAPALFARGDPDGASATIELAVVDARSATLIVRRATSSAFDVRTAFETFDGGATWSRVPLPTVAARAPLLGEERFQSVRALSDRVAWGARVEGWCAGEAPRRCETVSSLHATDDGGLTWRPLALPGARAVLRSAWETFTGQGFDKCDVATLDQAAAWWAGGPYRATNLYIGGAARGCRNEGLTREHALALAGQGWKLIPTWVGPQAPCTRFIARFSADAAEALDQGRAEADAAIARAAELGLSDARTPAVVYYNLEAFALANADCLAATRAFVHGWAERMRARGHVPGVYATACTMPYFVNLPSVPEAIWAAHWIRPAYDPEVTVWDLACLGNDVWVNSQRLRQYTGGHPETWGGVTMNVDSNAMDGPVAGGAAGPTPSPTATPSPTPTHTPSPAATPSPTATHTPSAPVIHTPTPLPAGWRAVHLPLVTRGR